MTPILNSFALIGRERHPVSQALWNLTKNYYASPSISVLDVELVIQKIQKSTEVSTKDSCNRKLVEKLRISCYTSGSGTLGLYRMKNGNWEAVKRVRARNDFSIAPRCVSTGVAYHIGEVTKEHEGYYVCYFDTLNYERVPSKQFYLQVEGKE